MAAAQPPLEPLLRALPVAPPPPPWDPGKIPGEGVADSRPVAKPEGGSAADTLAFFIRREEEELVLPLARLGRGQQIAHHWSRVLMAGLGTAWTRQVKGKDGLLFSTYAKMCNEIGQEIDAAKLECQLPRAINDIRMYYCNSCKSIFGTPREAKEAREGLQRLWPPMLRNDWASVGARAETKRAFKHAKRARRGGFDRVIDRYNKDKVDVVRMDSNGVNKTTMQEWDPLFLNRGTSPLPVYRKPCQQRH